MQDQSCVVAGWADKRSEDTGELHGLIRIEACKHVSIEIDMLNAFD